MKRLSLLMVLSGFSLGIQAGPQINVGTVYDYLDGDKSTYLKRVFNSGDSTAFVKVNILEIIYDADGTSREVPVKTQADASSRDGLMASPARLIVPANGMQGTRLLLMGNRDSERYFRVRFIPVVPEKEDEFAVSGEECEEYKKTLSAGVNVMTGFGTVFFVRPKNSRFDSVIDDNPNNYRLRNNGNTVVLIDEFRNCSLKNETDCEPTTKHHVLAGKTFEFEKKPGREYRFNLVEGDAKKTLRIASPS
ncbi:molecular chaperone [Pseudomonas sp. ANT_H12B]|uniref:molecular chaperone n=1 Tax=Pseudomonas sp. ANT_H12B TaxID=2597348 RepID=UPI0011EEC70E|nr:molecular chaperone [Pseudomonas sp. ANT_H12B]KAA0960449.1 molecular chaperone [Pseudomonas sp. ANT_H12B]